MTNLKHYYNIFLLGFFSIISQIFIIREVLFTFSGNELTAGLVLSVWLLGSGLGHFILKYFVQSLFNHSYKIFFFNLSFFIINIIILRFYYNIFHITFGEIISILHLFVYAVLCILPFSLLWGLNFNLFYLHIRNTEDKESKLYFLESGGACLGALFASLLGVHINSIFLIILFLFILFIFSLLLEKKHKTVFFYISIIFIILLSLFHNKINTLTEKRRFSNLKHIKSKESPYGKLSIIKQNKYLTFYQNGVLLFSESNYLTAEIDVSLPICQSESIENILIINNGISGLIQKLLPYPEIKNITYIEYNSFLLDFYSQYSDISYLKDDRIHIITEEPRKIISQIQYQYDIIFCNNGDPYNLQLNRYYTLEFFRSIKKRLTPTGIIYLRISSSENFISKYQSLYIGSIQETLKKVFKHVLLIGGDNCYIMASDRNNSFSTDLDELNEKSIIFNIQSDFFKNYFLKLNLDPLRLNNFQKSINHQAKINKDYNPICFFYNLVLWTTRTSQTIKNIFYLFYNIKFYYIIIFFLVLYILYMIFIKRTYDHSILLSMGTIGFTEISLEIIIILIYQIIRGNLYVNISLIFFSFMLGLSIGSYLTPKLRLSRNRLFILIQLLFIFIPLLLIILTPVIKNIQLHLLQDLIIIIYVFGFSILSGMQFPTAVKLFSDPVFGVGKINGFDLIGSSIGALIVSLFIIPLYGINNTLILLSFLNLLIFITIFQSFKLSLSAYKS